MVSSLFSTNVKDLFASAASTRPSFGDALMAFPLLSHPP
jgi:hypothetical protein